MSFDDKSSICFISINVCLTFFKLKYFQTIAPIFLSINGNIMGYFFIFLTRQANLLVLKKDSFVRCYAFKINSVFVSINIDVCLTFFFQISVF